MKFGISIAAIIAAGALAACGQQEEAAPVEDVTAAPAEVGGELTASFADATWTGTTVPEGQWCQKFMGMGATPALNVENIPAGATALRVAFNDETYEPMNNGGHGVLRFDVPAGATTASLPSVPGETDELPAGVTAEQPHQAQEYSGTGGAYLPPCSGGMGNTYSATIQAVDAGGATLGETRIVLGTY